MTREDVWKAYVEGCEIEVPQDRLEAEIHLIRVDLMHRMRYDTLSGGPIHPFPEWELEQQKDEIHAEALFEVKAELVMRDLMNRLHLSVSREELEAEAEAMAQRQNTTTDEIKRFFGEDLAMLERDVKEKKVLDWVCAQPRT